MIGKTVEINIKDTKTGAYLRIPVIPEVIEYVDGDALANSVNIINLGAVDFPNGVALDAVTWRSFFPARYDASYCKTANLLAPTEYRNRLSSWKDAGTPLQLIIPAAEINKTMYLQAFKWDVKGFEGDLYYEVTFKEYKEIRPLQIATSVAVVKSAQAQTPAARPPAPTPPKAKTYTVQRGDTLSGIAKKNGIASWNTLYEKNKAVIGSNPNLIKPGQVLTL